MQFNLPHHPPPLLPRLRVLLSWSIDSPHFHSRNPSAAYQHSSLSQGHCLFPHPWSWIPGLYSHHAIWISTFTQPPASKEMCLSGRVGSFYPGKEIYRIQIHRRGDLFGLEWALPMSRPLNCYVYYLHCLSCNLNSSFIPFCGVHPILNII